MDKCKHKTTVLTEQEPFSYALVMVDRHGQICEHISYMGEDAAEHFVETVLYLEMKYYDMVNQKFKKLEVTDEIQEAFDNATECYLCQKPFVNGDSVKDHDHMNGMRLALHKLTVPCCLTVLLF